MSSEGRKKIVIEYFTDVLCIWAYVAERRLEELIAAFGDEVEMRERAGWPPPTVPSAKAQAQLDRPDPAVPRGGRAAGSTP